MRLGPRSRELLDFLLVCAAEGTEAILFPRSTITRIGGWSESRYGNRQLSRLEERGWLDRADGVWVPRLTKEGKKVACDSIDPREAWDQPWDGAWRVLTFDLPERADNSRQQLRAWLKKRRFGCLQGSVWITHRGYENWSDEMALRKIDPKAAFFFEGQIVGERDDAAVVAAAWDFEKINEHYARYLSRLARHETGLLALSPTRLEEIFVDWFRHENALWRVAFDADPFLPRQLWPGGPEGAYLGPKAWAARRRAYARWSLLLGDGR